MQSRFVISGQPELMSEDIYVVMAERPSHAACGDRHRVGRHDVEVTTGGLITALVNGPSWSRPDLVGDE